MEVSANTSKRKFQSLLDNISNAAKSDPTSNQGKNEHSLSSRPVKRSRLRQAPLRKDNARSSLAGLKHNLVTERTTRRNDGDNVQHDKPVTSAGAYTPWSRDAFLYRLRTFADPHLWSPKPEAINELQWAKRGWICEDKETVACKGLCGRRLVIDLGLSQFGDEEVQDTDKDEQVHDIHKLEDTLAQKYRELIVDAHSEHCLWRKSGCREDIYRLPLLISAYWKSTFVSNYETLIRIAESLPNELNAPQLHDLKQEFVHLLSGSLQDDVSDSFFSSIAFKLALFGWKGEVVGEVALARCESCFQRIGLWLYLKTGEEIGKETGFAGSNHLELLDPIASHKYYCPWINASTQRAFNKYSGKAGWEIMQDIIIQNHAESEASSQALGEAEEPQDNAASIDEIDDARLSKLQQLKKIFSFKKKIK